MGFSLSVSLLCLFKSGYWGQVHSWAMESRVLGCRALRLRETSTVSAALELAGTVTGFKVSWLDPPPAPAVAAEIACAEMLVRSYGCECVCGKAVAHSCLMGNSRVRSTALQCAYWRR